MRKYLLSSLLFIPIVCYSQDLEQHVIGTGGETFTSGSASLCWTLGEAFTETYQANSYFLTQGFQQGVLVVTSFPEDQVEGPDFIAYPNPVNDKLIIEIEDYSLPFQIIDLSGEILLNGHFNGEKNEIHLGYLKPGIYFLSIDQKRTHKIIKK